MKPTIPFPEADLKISLYFFNSYHGLYNLRATNNFSLVSPMAFFNPACCGLEEAAKDEMITLIVQVNGKLRDRIVVEPGISDEDAKQLALASDAVSQTLEGRPIRKVIVVPGRLVNIVV